MITFLLIAISLTFAAQPSQPACTSTQEFVVTLEYLRSEADLAIPEHEARKVAARVVEGCSGAGGRFIRVTQVLSRAGLSGRDAVNEGVVLARRTDAVAEAFIAVFRKAVLADYLDLDIFSAMKLARSLSTEFEGDALAVRDDFERIVEFCSSAKSLDLPKPVCAQLAARVARRGQEFSGGVAAPFVRSFEFLTDPAKGPGIATGRALALAEELVGHGPGASDNFMQGFRYAVSPKGLSLGAGEAVAFARDMAVRTREPVVAAVAPVVAPVVRKKARSAGPSVSNRVPASERDSE